MNTSLGYAKRTLTDTSVLLSGGGDKPLSNFIGSISWDSTNKKITYTPVGGNATDLVSFGSYAFKSSLVTSDIPDLSGTYTKFYLSPMASSAPADSAKSWFVNTMPSSSGAIVYNVPGSEKTIIVGKSSGAYGHMLQLNYDDTYLRILRYIGGIWQSTDWEKISAGYADSAGNADTVDGYHADVFFRYRGELYLNNGHNANTLAIGSWIFRSSGYGNVGSGAAHANVTSENSTIEVFQNLQLSTPAWSNSVSYRVRWGGETNSSRPNAWSAWYTFLSNENYTNYVNNASLTLLTNGTTLTTFYANDDTNRTFNVTCANIGAATSEHNHDGRYLQYEGWWSSGETYNVDNSCGMNFVYSNHGAPTGWGILTTFEYARNAPYRMQLFSNGYDNGYTYYRNRSSDRNGWNAWVRFLDSSNYTEYCATSGHDHDDRYITALDTDGDYVTWTKNGTTNNLTVPYATSAENATTANSPYGFSFSNRASSDWSGVTGSFITDWEHSSGADIMFKNNGGALHVITDGYFYQGIDYRGATYRVLDEYDVSHITWGNSTKWGGYSRNRMRFPDLESTMNHIMPLNLAGLKSFGTPLSTDPEFSSGTDLLYVYNNNGNGTVTITRVTDAEAANSSGYVCKIVTNGSASPGAGGFYPSLSSRNSAVFLQIFRAKIPVGWQVNTASNSMGSGYSDDWITEQAGTGKWEWYGRLIHCGNSGTYSSGGHVYLTGTSNTSVTWYVSYHQIIDLTKANYDGLRTKYSDYATSAGSASSVAWDDVSGKPSVVTTDTTQTITGTKTFTDIRVYSLPENTEMPYFLGIDAFSDGGRIKWVSKADTKVGYASSAGYADSAGNAGSATNIAGGAQGSIPYLTAAGTTAFLAGGTNGYVLAYNTTSKAPYWKADSNTQYYLTLNGTTKGNANTNDLGTIYAPTSSGTGFLKCSVSGTTVTWSYDNSTYLTSHYTATPVLGGSSATSNATSNTSDPYLNIIENSTKSGGILLKGGGSTSVTAKNGVAIISSTNTLYYLTLNGSVKGTASTNDLGTIYAPSSAGTGFLKGTAGANGTITWSWDNSTYNNYELPTASSDTLGGVKTGSAITDTTGYTAVKVKDGVVYYKDTNTWTAADLNNAGYVPKSTKGKFLHANSSTGALEWTDDNNTWNAASTSQAGYVPKLATGGGTIASTDTAYVLAYKSGVSGTTAPVWIQLPANAYLNDNTWNAASTSLAGYVPKLALASTATIVTQSTEYVLTYISGTETAPVWRKLPTNAFNNTWTAWAGASSSSNGTAGYMPAPGTANYLKFLRGDGTWCSLNNYSLPTATDSALGGVKIGTTLTSTTGYTKVHIKDGFIYYKDTNTWQAANTSQVGYVPSTSANTMLYANSSGSATWGTPDLYEVNVGGNVDTAKTLTEKIAYGGVLGFYFGGGMLGYIDDDGVNINHASSALGATTIGSSTASSGSTVDIPYILTDEYGHVTAGGTHTHTISVSGYLPTGGGELTGSLTLPKTTLAIKFNTRTGAGIKYDYGGNEALMISARAYSAASILLYAGESSTTRSLDNNSGQWSASSSASNYMGIPSMQIKNGSVLINTAVQTGTLSGDYASALYVNGDTYLGGDVKSTGNIWAGKTSDTEERLVGVQSSAGTLYMYSQGSSTGSHGLYAGAHGNNSGKKIIDIDTNNNATFYGDVSGNATSAGSASTAGSAGSATYSTYLSSNTGGIAANTTNSLTYYNTYTTTTSSTTNGIANPTTAGSGTWYHHITMVRGDSNGFFFDLAFSLAESTTPRIYFRNRAASSYSTWKEIVTSANYTEYLTGGGGSIDLKHKTFSSLGSSTYYRLAYVYLSGTSNTTLSTLYYTSGLYVNNSGVYHTSDIAYKEAIRKYLLKKNVLDLENPVKKFKWKGTNDEAVGFIAQETEEWCPEAVGQDEDGYKTVNYTVALSGLCSALYDEVKTLRKEIEELKDKK